MKVSSVSHRRRCCGRVFQITAPAYENEHSAVLVMLVFVRGICSKVLSFCERRKYLEDTGMVSKLDRYSGAVLYVKNNT